MHLVNDLFENHKHSNPETAYKIYEQMRLIEKTRIVSQNNQTIHYQQMELPSKTDQLSFTSFISGNLYCDFTSVSNNIPLTNPCALWQFYCRKITDIKFFQGILSSGNTIFALSSLDRYLNIYDLEENSLIRVIENIEGYFTCLNFSKDGRLLAAGCISKIIFIFETVNFSPLVILTGLATVPNNLCFDNNFSEIIKAKKNLGKSGKAQKKNPKENKIINLKPIEESQSMN